MDGEIEAQTEPVKALSTATVFAADDDEYGIDDIDGASLDQISMLEDDALDKTNTILETASNIAQTHMNLNSLHTFQIPVIVRACEGNSVLLVSACGSGKSVCFTVPALYHHRKGKVTFVVEPSIALIQEQVENLTRNDIDAVALGNAAHRDLQKENFDRLISGSCPVLAYCTPEYLAKQANDKLEEVLAKRTSMIVIDEVHKLLDRRAAYRSAYDDIKSVVNRHNLQVFCCSATVSENWLARLLLVFPDVKTYISPVKRNKVAMSLEGYSRNKDGKTWNWTSVIDVIKTKAKDNVLIAFFDFQNDAKKITEDLTDGGTPARYLVGANMNSNEKQIAASAFRDGQENILVATETFECGMHNDNTSYVLRVGAARNLAVLIQEMGRTGRKNDNGHFTLLYSEYHDDQRLARWAKVDGKNIDVLDEETKIVISDFVAVWRFIYSEKAGVCLHEALSLLYGDPAEPKTPLLSDSIRHVDGCKCSNCASPSKHLVHVTREMLDLLKALEQLEKVEIKVTMVQLREFLLQNSTKWNREHGTAFLDCDCFGCALEWPNFSEESVLNIIRIAIYLNLVSLYYEFYTIQTGGIRTIRRVGLSDDGKYFLEAPFDVVVPDLSEGERSMSKTKVKPRRSGGLEKKGVRLVKDMMAKDNCWLPINAEEYRLLGYNGETFPFLYHVPDWTATAFKGKNKYFMREDLQLTKGKSQSASKLAHVVELYGDKIQVDIYQNKCMGTKRCPVDGCMHSCNNFAKFNECPEHKQEERGLVASGTDCPAIFVHIYPQRSGDEQQWFGCIGEPHNHPPPVDWRLRSKTKKDLAEAKVNNPLNKPKDFQQGTGMTYVPMYSDPAACHTGRISRIINKGASSSSSAQTYSCLTIIDNFEAIRADLASRSETENADKSVLAEVNKLMGVYKEQKAVIDDKMFGIFCATWQKDIFSKATHLFIDIVYIRNDQMPGLMNIVAPCDELRRYVPVFRIFLNKQDAGAIAYAINEAFKIITKYDSNFSKESIKQIMVDFSDAEDNGLREVLGDDLADIILRGCKFHFMNSVQRVANMVTETNAQKTAFVQLAKKIPDCKEQNAVTEIFEILRGSKSIPESTALQLFTEEEAERMALVQNQKWNGSRHWVDWWLRPRHLQKVSLAYTGLEEEVWSNSQATNNPVESINRTSKTLHTCSFLEAIQHVYYEDRRIALLLVASRNGRSITYCQTPRKNRKRKQPKNTMGDAFNPPDTKKKLKMNKIPRGQKAVGHMIQILYENDDGGADWQKGKIILYDKSKGYCIRFNGEGPEGDQWEKKLASEDVRFLS